MRNIYRRILFVLALLIALHIPAFAVDMVVFGLKLGDAFTVNECKRFPSGSSYEGSDEQICYRRYTVFKSMTQQLPTTPFVTEPITIVFPSSQQPQLPSDGEVKALVINGNLEGVSFSTGGIKAAEKVLATLSEKYGKPTVLIPQKVQNRFGATYEYNNASWKLPNLNIDFLAAVGSINAGLVRIDTDKAKLWREKQSAEIDKDKRPL